MDDLRVRRTETGHTRIRNVPIAVTPEGFWCCPSPAAFQKTLKSQMNQTKPKPSSSPMTSSQKSSSQKSNTQQVGKKQNPNSSRSRNVSNEQKCVTSEVPSPPPAPAADRAIKSPVENNPQKKISVGFGQQETSDVKVLVSGKENIVVRMNVHKSVLANHSSFFDEKLSRESSPVLFIEIGDCEDVEIYVETVGLMYCREMKQRLIKLSVTRVLRVLKVGSRV